MSLPSLHPKFGQLRGWKKFLSKSMLLRKKKEQKQVQEKIRAHVFISGRVQGVFFRTNTKEEADRLGVLGWVKNLPDGRVEAVFEGNREKVEEMVNWTSKGPIWAKIDDFSVTWEDYTGEFSNFEIRHDLLQ